MEILFAKKRLADICNSGKESRKEWGEAGAKKIGQRLRELRAVNTLQDMWQLPGAGFHALHGDREGQFAVNLNGANRLIMEPVEGEGSEDLGQGKDLKEIRTIRILEVVDYH